MKNKFYVIVSALIFVMVCGVVVACNGSDTTPPTNTNKLKLDTLNFYKENPSEADNFKVYIESSASMDGYVNGNTKFKTALHCIIGEVITDVLKDENNAKYYYIDSNPHLIKGSYREFVKNMSPASLYNEASKKDSCGRVCGDRSTSDIIDIMYKVIDSTGVNDVTMFVSDCVYSPESSADIEKALNKQKTDITNKLTNKTKNLKDFGVLVYRMVSDFDGIYYTKTDAPIPCKGKRPYFVWFFGKKSILANVYKSLSSVMADNKEEYEVDSYIQGVVPQYEYMPYVAPGTNGGYCSFKDKKTNNAGVYKFSFFADMSKLPFSEEFLLNSENYTCSKKCKIKKIEKIGKNSSSKSKYNKYNYEYTIVVEGSKNERVSPMCVNVSLKAPKSNVAEWVKKYNDPKGEDYDKGYDGTKIRTFGIESLIEGVDEFYQNSKVVTFKININNEKNK